jgi:aspartokinase
MEMALQSFDAHNTASGSAPPIEEKQPSANVIHSIKVRTGLSVVTLTSTRRLRACKFLYKVFDAFARHQIHFDFVTVSEVAVSVVLGNIEKLDAIKRDLDHAGQIKVERHKAMVSLEAGNVRFDTGITRQIFQAIEKINVNVISKGDSGKEMSFVVNESEVDAVAYSLFEEFFKKSYASKGVARA